MNIILFDGVCNLCNTTVLFLIRHDKKQNLHFAAQQSESGQQIMQQHHLTGDNNSVILINDNRVYYKSDAIIETAKLITGWPKVFKYSIIVPRFLRDAIYNVIAKYRYKIFGKKPICALPTESHKHKFL